MDYNFFTKQYMEAAGNNNKLLLHVCCAGCALGVLPRLSGFSVTPYFYNPNLDSKREYDLRSMEVSKICGGEIAKNNFDGYVRMPIICEYDHEEFLGVAKTCENDKEGGARCEKCIRLRIFAAAKYAADKGYDYFCSTLSVSPHKNANLINDIGEQASKIYNIKHLPNDFKKEEGFKKGTLLSKQYAIYRQGYCGCEFSRYDNK